MSSLDQWRQIALASLGLPDEKLLGVLALVERVPDRDQVREVLDKMRPRLVQLRPPRPLTPQRLLFQPVEDLFDPPERYRAKIGRLSRHAIQPCWTIIRNTVEPALLTEAGNQLRPLHTTQFTEIRAIGLPFWKAAAVGLSTFLDGDNSIGRHKVGTESVVVTEDMRQQLLDIADILAIATEIETVKAHLPERPIQSLSKVDAELLTDVITRLGTESTRKVQTFLLVILARMLKPGDLLEVLAEVSLPCTTNERSSMVKTVGTSALATLANEAHNLRNPNAWLSDPSTGAQAAEQMVTRLTSLERSLGGLRDRAVAEQVKTARREIGTFVLEKLVAKADESLFGNLKPTPEMIAKTGKTEPTIEQVETAERSALSLRRCARVAESVGVRKEMEQKLAGICSQLERQTVSANKDGQRDERHMIRSVRLIEMIAGPDEAQRVLMAQFTAPSDS